jgi:hypothetical protein
MTDFQNVPAYTAGNLPEIAKTGAIQTKTEYFTAQRVQVSREIETVRSQLLTEARFAGEDFYYSFEIKTKHGPQIIEGPSIGLASSATRLYRNCFTDILMEDEKEYSWVFKAIFVDLENGFHCSRVYVQPRPIPLSKSKNLEFSDKRKLVMECQSGQSKAIRNVAVMGLPGWLLAHAVETAKRAVVESSGDDSKKKLENVIRYFDKIGVTPTDLTRFLGSPEKKWAELEIAKLREVASTIRQGVATVDEIFHTVDQHQEMRRDQQLDTLKPDPPEMPLLKPADEKTAAAYDKLDDEIFDNDGIPPKEERKQDRKMRL